MISGGTGTVAGQRCALGRAGVAMVAVVLTVLATIMGVAPAQAEDAMVGTIELTYLNTTDSGLELTLTVTNTGAVPLYGGQVMLWRDDTVLTTRAGLEARLSEDPNAAAGERLGQPRSAYHVLGDQQTPFNPGESVQVSLAATWPDLNFTTAGVYLVGAQLYASESPTADGRVVARARTLVTRAGGTTAHTTHFVRLTSAPSYLTGNVFSDDHLATDFAERLLDLAYLAERPGWGWIIDPALYHAAEIMAAEPGYVVQTAQGETPGGGGAAAAHWLEVVDQLPRFAGWRTLWADPDLVLGAVLGDAAFRERAQDRPDPTSFSPNLTTLLALPLVDRPFHGQADAAYLDYVAPTKPALTLVRSDVAAGQGLTVTTQPTAYPGGPGPDDPATAFQQRQRAIADDYLAAAAGLVNVRVLSTEAEIAALPTNLPDWITPLSVTELIADPTWISQPVSVVPALAAALRDAQEPVLAAVATAAELIGEAAALMPVAAGLPAIVSQDWPDQATALAYAAAVEAVAVAPLRQVRILLAERIDLTSRQTSLPLTIANDLPQTIRLRLEFRSSSPVRLALDYAEVVEVKAGSRLTLALAPRISADGQVVLSARLLTESGRPIGPAVTSEVVVTQSGLLALAIVAVSGLVLAVGTVLRVTTIQRTRRAEAATGVAPSDTAAGAETPPAELHHSVVETPPAELGHLVAEAAAAGATPPEEPEGSLDDG